MPRVGARPPGHPRDVALRDNSQPSHSFLLQARMFSTGFFAKLGSSERDSAEFESYRKTLSTEEARRAFDERIESLLSKHGVDYVRGYVDALKDAPFRI